MKRRKVENNTEKYTYSTAFTHVHNRCPTAALKSGTPYELWHKSKPDVAHFRVFGCTSYVHVKKVLKGYKAQMVTDRNYVPAMVSVRTILAISYIPMSQQW